VSSVACGLRRLGVADRVGGEGERALLGDWGVEAAGSGAGVGVLVEVVAVVVVMTLGIRGRAWTSPNLSAERIVRLSLVRVREQGRLGIALGRVSVFAVDG
jgi:hypothetical protein